MTDKRPATVEDAENQPSPWNPKATFTEDRVSGKVHVTINLGLGFPWVARPLFDLFLTIESGPVFESMEQAEQAARLSCDSIKELAGSFNRV